MSNNSNPLFEEQHESDVLTAVEPPHHLLVWNDDTNTFEWVIDTLMEICGHSKEQAEQCAMLIHFKGKYAVKKDSYEKLKPQCEAINDRNINATIEALV
jgi:ATP-dependent Clp protease adaptor protein ClpS